MVDVVEVLAHWHAGRSKSEIARSLGLDRKTVRKYVAGAEAEGIRGWGTMEQPLALRANWLVGA